MSINRGLDKEDVVHICNGILLSHEKNEIMSFAATWMDLKIISLSQTEMEHSEIMNMWNPKNGTKELIKQEPTQRF